jgi:large subunit ribosomal protein L24
MKLKTGDKVVVITGKDKGKTGKVLRVFPGAGALMVEGANLVKKRQKPRREREKGQTVEMSRPLDASNVQLYCERCKRGVRLGAKINAKGKKERVCRRCGATL